MADVSPFALLQQGQENTNAAFLGIQRSLVQTRELQLRQQQQMFNQSYDLKKLEVMEKQQVFDNQITLKKLDMQERQMGWDDVMNAERLRSQQAMTGYRNAQTARLTAEDVATQNIPWPVNGSAEDWSAYDESVTTGATAIQGEFDPVVGAVLDEFTTDSAGSPDEPSTSPPMGELFADPFQASTGPLGSLAPTAASMQRADRAGAAVVASQAQAAQQPKTDFERISRRINTTIGSVMSSDQPQGIRQAQVAQLQGNLMRIAAQQQATDPKARDFLNGIAPEREAVETAAAQGDWAMARKLIEENRQQYGAVNPVLNDAYNAGAAANKQAKLLEAKYDQYQKALSALEKYNTMGAEPPPALASAVDRLANELYGQASPDQIGNTLNSLRPR